MSGWVATQTDQAGLLIEHPGYVTCRVPEWRVVFKEPPDLKAPPSIPESAEWKLV